MAIPQQLRYHSRVHKILRRRPAALQWRQRPAGDFAICLANAEIASETPAPQEGNLLRHPAK